MIRILVCLAFILSIYSALCPAHAGSQRMEFGSSPNPVGSGARALGMGGAFIAVADDATAASWNPGGLTQLERPEASVAGAGLYRMEDNSFGSFPKASGGQDKLEASLNYLSATYPFEAIGHIMVVSVSYQHLYDFSRAWHGLPGRGSLGRTDYEQQGGLYAYGLSYAIRLSKSFSAGFTLNVWQDGLYDNQWNEELLIDGKVFHKVRRSLEGLNANIGALWSPSNRLTVGAVFKTPFSADIGFSSWDAAESPARSSSSQSLDMPMSYGFGAAYRFSDRLIASVDVYHTHWNDFILTDAHGRSTSAVSGQPSGRSDVGNTTQVRLGAEYFFIRPPHTIPVRGGIFYDPAPAEGSPDTYLGFGLGSGIKLGRFVFDCAYQYRFGRDVGSSMAPALKFSQDVDEHTFYSSVIVYF